MSGIFGLFHRDGRPAEALILERMSQALSRRGPHGAGIQREGPVGIGHRLLRATSGSVEEPQPFFDPRRLLWITLDGRVDNPEELRKILDPSEVLLRTRSDVELLAAAYEKWEVDCPRHVLGDFAFAIWDVRHRFLFCARDPVGVKPFVYRATADRFLFASELQALVRGDPGSLRANEGMAGEYMVDRIESREETLITGYLRLPPGHTLIVTPDRIEKRQYWAIDPDRWIRYKSDAEYADHFRQVFGQAVGSRMRNCASVGVSLSGGLDSSSVFATARRVTERDPSTIQAFSLIFQGLDCDESEWIRDLLDKEGTSGHTAEPEKPGLDRDLELVRHYLDIPDYPNWFAWDSLRRGAGKQGVSVLLTGLGGDQWFSGSSSRLARLLWSLGLPRLAIRAAQRMVRRIRSVASGDLAPLTADFVSATDLRDRIRQPAVAPGFVNHTQEALARHLTSGWEAHMLEMWDRSSSSFGIEQWHPFYDRRVIELAFALPPEQHRRGGSGKFILREAMKGWLPQSIRLRKSKADFSHLFPEALERKGGAALFSSMEIAKAGWVSQEQVQSMYRRTFNLYKSGAPGYYRCIWPLAMIAGIELWFRTLFCGRDALENVRSEDPAEARIGR